MSTFAFTLPWRAILACIVGILAIVLATMMVAGAMIRNDNIVDTISQGGESVNGRCVGILGLSFPRSATRLASSTSAMSAWSAAWR